ncbi:ATP synthase subunit C family protein [Orientia chuto str. Dubai]|uniref:ATP synthase subunit c n=1 Tax=Orientia chuto str. Dubai TaxID=1359168 RepID=A0A0F3MIX9_9RICK|nr:F0F1 ATP synthase subunit C [Candidatus Orientia mediorientalis]KJV55723.1 ATP synthase subunit C family protein [Orientia chuto str. Dubai]
MDPISFKYIAVAFMAFGMAGAALGVASIFNALMNSIARNPSATEDLQKAALIGAGLAEAMGLFSFILAILLMFT